jgi:hypothetical protein
MVVFHVSTFILQLQPVLVVMIDVFCLIR